jgi:hypothetical protein
LYCSSDKPTPSNSPPVITRTFPAGDTTLHTGDSLILDLEAVDADGDRIEKMARLGNTNYFLPFVFRHDTVGAFEFIFIASDNRASDEAIVNIYFNRTPSFILIEPNDTTIQTGDSVYVNAMAEDPDGESLTCLFIHDNDTLSVPHWYAPISRDNTIKYVASDWLETIEAYRSIVMGNISPVCNFTSHEDDDTLIIGNIAVTVEATDSDGYIESVEFYIDNILLFTDIEEPYDFVYTEPWFEVGNAIVKAIAKDNDGAETECEITIFLTLFMPVNPYPDTIFVPQDYSLIQDAIDNSQDGDVIMIADGTYEEIVHITHPLSLIGNGENTVIDDRWISVESDCVIIRNIKARGYGNHISHVDGAPGIIIGGDYVLLDSVFAYGGWCNAHEFPYPGYYVCTTAGAGVEIVNSSHIIIKNSDIRGGDCNESYCYLSGEPGPGTVSVSAISVFIVDSRMEGHWRGNCVVASNYSYIGIRNCDIIGNLNNDSTSTIIFP